MQVNIPYIQHLGMGEFDRIFRKQMENKTCPNLNFVFCR